MGDWTHLVGLRAILGVLEAGFFPGVVYLMSTWYKRYEMGKRYAGFYLIGCVASAFGGILAFGLMHGGNCRLRWMALDFHHRRNPHSRRRWSRCSLPPLL